MSIYVWLIHMFDTYNHKMQFYCLKISGRPYKTGGCGGGYAAPQSLSSSEKQFCQVQKNKCILEYYFSCRKACQRCFVF